MDHDTVQPSHHRNKPLMILLALILLVLVGILAAVLLNRGDDGNGRATPPPPPPANNQTSQTSDDAGRGIDELKQLVSYDVPGGMTESACQTAEDGIVYTSSGQSAPDCGRLDDPSQALRLYLDPSGPQDCNELQDVKDVSKHTCRSTFIDGKKTLEALTEYNADSKYGKPVRHAAYYLDTGKGVVVASFLGEPGDGDALQAELERLAQSVKVR